MYFACPLRLGVNLTLHEKKLCCMKISQTEQVLDSAKLLYLSMPLVT